MDMWNRANDNLTAAQRQIEKEAGGLSSDQRLTVALVQALLSISQELSLIRDEGLNPEHDSPRP